jgi:chromosome partitioning protein
LDWGGLVALAGRVIVIANQKGGVAKTTTAVNCAIALSQSGLRVLLVDLDPQANATSGLLGWNVPRTSNKTIYDVLCDPDNLNEAVIETRSGLAVLPADQDLVGAELELASALQRESRLRIALRSSLFCEKFDFVLLDTPPSLGLLTLNGLVAADSVVIPVQCEYYAMEGLRSLVSTVARVRERFNPALQIEGILLTMFDGRNRLSQDVVGEVRSRFGHKVFETVIPRNVRVSESPSHAMAVVEYDPRSSGAEAYRQFALELAGRNGNGPNSGLC